ncbi:MAG: THxN family PEP-CTERM protein [Pseudomonadota bacterium]
MRPVNRLMQGVAMTAVLAAGSASATTIDILSVSGIWTSATGSGGSISSGTNVITWGTPILTDPSGYSFEAEEYPNTPPPTDVALGEVFDIGTFTHMNQRITGTTLLDATLEVEISFTIDGVTPAVVATSTFDFSHEETPNQRDGDTIFQVQCPYDGLNGQGLNAEGCADRVVAETNVESSTPFNVNGQDYVLTFSGFKVGDDIFESFITEERKDNEATLTAKLEAVPLPAAGWLLVAGLGGLAAMKRRKKALADA